MRIPLSVALTLLLLLAACNRAKDETSDSGGAPPGESTTKLLFRGSFEGADLKKWDFSWLRERNAVSLSGSPVRKGNGALRVTLSREQKMFSKGKRSELAVPITFEMGKAYWYAVSIYVPPTWKEDFQGEVMTQWFATRDKELGEKGRSPSLAIRINKNKWHVTNRWDPRPLTPKNSGHKETLFSAPLERGKWTDWAIYVRWSYKDDGAIRIHMNQRLVASKAGPNTYNDRRGPIMKLGIYKAPWNNPKTPSAVSFREAWFDEIRIAPGTATLEEVSP